MRLIRLEPSPPWSRLAEPPVAAVSLLRRRRLLRKRPWPGFGEPFNGQRIRERTVDSLIACFSPDALVETGTFMGFTTRWLCGYGLPTYTIEVSARYRHAARFALRDLENLTMIWGDSIDGLTMLTRDTAIGRPLAYLDAHWEEHLPLDGELERLFSRWRNLITVIDDFRVPGEPAYGYDVYGGVPIALETTKIPKRAVVAFPAFPAAGETGSRRGTAFVAGGEEGRRALEVAEQAGLVKIQAEQ